MRDIVTEGGAGTRPAPHRAHAAASDWTPTATACMQTITYRQEAEMSAHLRVYTVREPTETAMTPATLDPRARDRAVAPVPVPGPDVDGALARLSASVQRALQRVEAARRQALQEPR